MGLGAWSELFEKHYGTYYVNVHNSYIQLYADTGILGVIAAVVASVVLVKLSRRILVSVKQSPWCGVGIGIIAGVIAGAAGSIFEVIITGAFKTTQYYYMGIPLLWIWAALLVVSYQRVFISLPCITGKQGLLRINTLK
jgi:O-antigen ligase